jgi:beta-glucanase (GH16 family)
MSFDPIAAATAPGASAAEVQAALNIKAASTSVSNILDVASESLSSAGVSAANATQAAANVITSKLTTPGFSLADATVVEDTLISIINESGATIDPGVAASLSSSLGTKIAAANASTFTAASSGDSDALQQIYKAAKTAQVGLAESATTVLEADDPSAALSDLDQFDVDAEIASASVPNNNAFGGLDFELEASEYQIEFFEGASGGLLTDPTDATNSVLTFVRTPESKHYSGVHLGYLTGSTVGEIPINADADETTINARIWSPSDDIVARMEIVDTSAVSEGNMYFNVHAEATLSSGWNDVVFDFASPVVRYVDQQNGSLATPIAAEATYDQLNLAIDWNNGKNFDGSQVGAAITEDVTYYVDNIIMGFGDPVYYAGGAVDDSTTSVDDPAGNPVTDGTFDVAIADTTTWSGNAHNPVDGVNVSNNEVSTNAYDVNLSGTVVLTPGADYTLTFDAKGEAGRTLIAGIGESGGAYRNDTETVTIYADWETYTLHLTATGDDTAPFEGAMRVLFDMGLDAGAVNLDNVKIASGHNGYETKAYAESPTTTADLTGYSLVFEDEFNAVGESPNSTKWTFDVGGDGWGNNEEQDYQSDLDDAQIIDWDTSSSVNGALRITAKSADDTITSARVKSDIDVGPYGYYEVRAKLPAEAGAWPAIWLLGEGGRDTWPDDGEIDLVEWSSAQASGDTQIISALHYPAANGGNANVTNATLTSAVDEWHTYQLWWTPDSIKIGVDGTEADAHLVYSKPQNATNNTWPYDGPMDLILNIAIGGTLGGDVPNSSFEYAMDIDYVRIYQIDGTEAEATPTELTLTFGADDGSGYTLTDFEGNASSIVTGADAPAGSDGSVVKVQKTAGAQTWAGTSFFELSGDGELISDGATIVTAEVFSPKDAATVRLKLEDSADDGIFVELDATTESNGAEAWETLTWDLSTVVGLNHSNSYNKASIFFDFGNAGDDEVYYLDDVNFGGYIA